MRKRVVGLVTNDSPLPDRDWLDLERWPKSKSPPRILRIPSSQPWCPEQNPVGEPGNRDNRLSGSSSIGRNG